MCKNTYQGSWIIIFIFLLLAGMTRFYHLDWSFWGDEMASFTEAKSLMERPFFLSEFLEEDYLGRGIPVGVSLQALSYKLFGTSEAGSRTGVAVAGTVAIPLIVLLTFYLYGKLVGGILGVMLVLSPWLILFSQNNRVYPFAFLFGSTALLAAALAWKYTNVKWAVISGIFSAIAVSTHNPTIIIPIGLGTFVIFEKIFYRTRLPWRVIRGYMVSGIPLLLVSCFLVWRAMQHWIAAAYQGGYTSMHVLMGLAFNLNWGLTLFACAGWVWALCYSKEPCDRLWAVVAGVATFFALVAPLFLHLRPEYLLPNSLPFFLLTARIIGIMYTAIQKAQNRIIASAVVIAFLLLPLPSFISYYADGNRHDYRAAAQFIKAHYQPGDIIAAAWPGILKHYLALPVESANDIVFQPEHMIKQLEQFISQGNRVWLVFTLSRQEPQVKVDLWLWENAVRKLRIKKKRFDYHENITDVYLIPGKS